MTRAKTSSKPVTRTKPPTKKAPARAKPARKPATAKAPAAARPPGPAAKSDTSHATAAGAATLLERLLDAWRSTRHARLADAIDAVARVSEVAPLAGAADWNARAKSPKPEDVTALLAALLDGVKIPEVGARVEALGTLAPDPRVAAKYVEMLRAPPFTASSNRPIWTKILAQLVERHTDPRAADDVRAMAPDYTQIFGDTVTGKHMRAALEKAGPAIDHALAAFPLCRVALAAEHEALVREAPAPAPPTSVATPVVDEEMALLRAVAEDPTDDARREAYRALLDAKGDPWAEVIALQERRFKRGTATAQELAREEDLLKKHAKRWLGPLAPVVLEPKFARGFLVECCLNPKGTKTGPAIGDPRWATVETLHFTYQRNWGRDVFMHPVMSGVRRLEGAPNALVEELLQDPTPRVIESIELMYGVLPKVLPATLVAPGLMSLREFSISCWLFDADKSKYTSTWNPPAIFADFLKSPFAARLEVLRWSIHDSQIVELHDALEAHAGNAFRARVEAYYFAFLRGGDGRWSDVEVRVDSVDDALKYMNSGVKAVLHLSPERVKRLTVKVAQGEDPTRLKTHLDAIRARFPEAALALPA